MSMRRVHTWSCAVAVSLLAASCSLVTPVPDLTSGSLDDGDGGAGEGGVDASFCAPHTFTYDPKGRALTSVHVGGAFNGWPKTIAGGGWPLVKTGGTWTLTRALPRGKNLYKLVLNESEWITDPANPKVETDASGNKNSVVESVCTDH
jgi:Glycogen recognition site of AMP-activated protein kinase